VRLQRAHELLQQNAGTASEVAYRTGFSSPAYFNHCFHQHFGHSPGEVRKTATGQHVSEPDPTSAPVAPPAALPPEAAGRPARARRRLILQIALTLAMVLALGYALYALLNRPPAQAPVRESPSIAVLPFDYLGADESKNYLADGVLDAITSHLAGIPELRVIARSSVEKYRQSAADARDIGKDLKVSYLLEGSFHLEGDRVRLTAQLVHSKDGSHLWSRTYDREWSDIFSVQSEVATAIAEAIQITVSPEAKATMQARSTPDLTAYEYYLKARHYITYDFQEENHAFAIQMYEKALGRDPDFAPAWLGLVEAYRSQYWLFMDRSDELVARIKTCLAKAKALEPDSKEYRWHEALYLHSIEREYPRVIRLLEQMLNDYPNDDLLLSFMGFVYGTMGIYDECAEYLEAAIALNPADWDYWNTISIFYEAMREYNEALRCNLWIIENHPSSLGAYARMIELYRSAGRYAEAEDLIEKYKNHLGGPVGLGRRKAWVAIYKGDAKTAIRITEALPEFEISWGWTYSTRFTDLARFYKYAGMDSAATACFQQSRDFFRPKIEHSKRDYRLHAALGVACAGLGLADEALAAGRRALEL
jgi:serine/threonine-protein kinase